MASVEIVGANGFNRSGILVPIYYDKFVSGCGFWMLSHPYHLLKYAYRFGLNPF